MGATISTYTEKFRDAMHSEWILNTADSVSYCVYLRMLEDSSIFANMAFGTHDEVGKPEMDYTVTVDGAREDYFHNQMEVAKNNKNLREFALAINALMFKPIDPDVRTNLITLFKELTQEPNIKDRHNQIVINHFTSLAKKLETSPILTPKEVTKFSNDLDRALYGKKPLSTNMKAAIGAIIGALVGLAVGLVIGAAITAHAGGIGAIPGMLIGMAKGFTLGNYIAAGTVFAGTFSGFLFGANSGRKNNLAHIKNQNEACLNPHVDRAERLVTRLKKS